MVGTGSPAAAQLPPDGLPGLASGWSRLVTDATGATWHVLDTDPPAPRVTLLCVHGNPTWAYLWRGLLAAAPPSVRVVAVDQLEMGFSERTGRRRSLADRIADLAGLTEAISLDGPVVTVGHDWGGVVSLGWALDHPEQLWGIVLANTAVHRAGRTSGSSLLRAVQLGPVRRFLCERTPIFMRGATELSSPRPPREVRRAYESPYTTPRRRKGIGDFVADIPFAPDHPTAATLADITTRLDDLGDIPALLVWGARDPVFGDVFLRDLQERFPGAVAHRFAEAGHLVPEDADTAAVVLSWLGELMARRTADSGRRVRGPSSAAGSSRRVWSALEERAHDDALAMAEIAGGEVRRITFADLERRVQDLAGGLRSHGVAPGDRVALLVEPGIDLAATLHALWRVGAVAVFVDAGLGGRGISAALASAAPQYLIGAVKALAAAGVLRWPGERISVAELSAPLRSALRIAADLPDLRRAGRTSAVDLARPTPDDVAAIVFTSGATGPAKGVRYRHRQVEAQRDVLMRLYGIQPTDRLVAAFAPFALYGPLMGIASMVPDMEITAPASLTAAKLAEAVRAIDATMVFASPAALRNVVATAAALRPQQRRALQGVRLALSAGAPVERTLLRALREVLPTAEIHTPYGMTEALPVADVTLDELEQLHDGRGVCVGHPVAGVDVAIAPLDPSGHPAPDPVASPNVTGEVCVRAEHMRDGYDQLWATEAAASSPAGWHRTGDVGHLDGSGRLWIEGRLAHVVTTAGGPVTPVPIEQRINALPGVKRSALVGVGPAGVEVLVAIVEPVAPQGSTGRADLALADAVRSVSDVDIAAVLTLSALPVDIRHNSKIDRLALARWAEDVCAGRRSSAP